MLLVSETGSCNIVHAGLNLCLPSASATAVCYHIQLKSHFWGPLTSPQTTSAYSISHLPTEASYSASWVPDRPGGSETVNFASSQRSRVACLGWGRACLPTCLFSAMSFPSASCPLAGKAGVSTQSHRVFGKVAGLLQRAEHLCHSRDGFATAKLIRLGEKLFQLPADS